MSEDGRCRTCGTITNLPPRLTHADVQVGDWVQVEQPYSGNVTQGPVTAMGDTFGEATVTVTKLGDVPRKWIQEVRRG